MTSTLLDASLCLLLVSASVVAVTTVPGDPGSRNGTETANADAAAETLATSTATVNYTLAPGVRRLPGSGITVPSREGATFCRTTHGTLAALLADAAMGRVTVRGERLTHARDDLAAGVRKAVRAAVGGTHTQVVAVWSPYPGAPVRGRMTVGERPPPGADVRAARIVAASGGSHADRRSAGDGGDDYDAVARSAAERTVQVLFPAAAMRFALGADHPTSTLVRRRYARIENLTAASGLLERASRGEVRAANRRLTAAFEDRFERDLRREFDSPAEARRAVAVGRVRIVVRRWSA